MWTIGNPFSKQTLDFGQKVWDTSTVSTDVQIAPGVTTPMLGNVGIEGAPESQPTRLDPQILGILQQHGRWIQSPTGPIQQGTRYAWASALQDIVSGWRERNRARDAFTGAAGINPYYAGLQKIEGEQDLMGTIAGGRTAALAKEQELMGEAGTAQAQALLDQLQFQKSLDLQRILGLEASEAASAAGRYGMAGSILGGAAQGIGAAKCCFIFLEARYGNGIMDRVVRRFRDEHMTPKSRRGYYRVAGVLVPLMRRYWFVKLLVRLTMTSPMVSFGKWYYRCGRVGRIFRPVTLFWLRLFDYLGGEHPYIRETGEVV